MCWDRYFLLWISFLLVFLPVHRKVTLRNLYTDLNFFLRCYFVNCLSFEMYFPVENVPYIFNHVAGESFNLEFYTIFKGQSHPQTALD